MTRRLVLLLAALAATACSKETTPVEPTSTPLPSLGLSIVPAAAGDRPGTLTLEGHFCPCLGGSVSVTINGTPSGSLGCGETKVFPTNSLPLRLQMTSSGINPFDAAVSTLDIPGTSPELFGVRAGVWCATPSD
ncbi:MAG: hypothetical protein ACHQPI_01980 [Thermoanaerobaculia bacterium]